MSPLHNARLLPLTLPLLFATWAAGCGGPAEQRTPTTDPPISGGADVEASTSIWVEENENLDGHHTAPEEQDLGNEDDFLVGCDTEYAEAWEHEEHMAVLRAPGHEPGERFADSQRDVELERIRVTANEQNDVIDIDEWFAENPLAREATLPQGFPSTSGGSPFMFVTTLGETLVAYGDRQSITRVLYHDTAGELQALDLAELDAMYTTIRHAELHGGIVYLNYANPMSAEANNGDNGYVVAVDASDGSLLWRSETLRANSYNFIVLGDVLLAGYGFTDEPDYIYAINRHTGRVIEELRVPTMAEYFSLLETRELDGGVVVYEVAVRTYDRNLVIELRVPGGVFASP